MGLKITKPFEVSNFSVPKISIVEEEGVFIEDKKLHGVVKYGLESKTENSESWMELSVTLAVEVAPNLST